MTSVAVVTFDVTTDPLNDGDPSEYLCVCDELPEFIGRGLTEEDAALDLCAQLSEIVWH